MVVSFHPLILAERNLLCAGRDPGPEELAAVREARAVVLPQGCRQSLYEMARQNCRYVFPNYDSRFSHPGKIGQIRLFRETGIPHPATATFASTAALLERRSGENSGLPALPFPCVLKFDWGGEGETVFLVESHAELEVRLAGAAAFESSGQRGFLLQEFIPGGHRSLRVVVVGERLVSYGRIGDNESGLYSNLSKGGRIEADFDPRLRHAGESLCLELCRRSGINLAGFDVIFRRTREAFEPLLLEINYFFGRKGLGGSEAYYRLLQQEVANWIRGVA